MGRTIPSITHRIESKLRQWEKFGRLLSVREQEAFQRLASIFKNRRTAIAEADESDLGIAMLLSAAVYHESEKDMNGEFRGGMHEKRRYRHEY